MGAINVKLSGDELDWLNLFLENTVGVSTLTFDNQGIILSHNQLIAKLLTTRTNLVGKPFKEFVTDESWQTLSSCQAEPQSYHSQLKITFKSDENQLCPLTCHFFCKENLNLIIGEKLMLTSNDIFEKMANLNTELVNLTRELQRKNSALKQANNTIKSLEGIIPICSYCKVIRDDSGYWNKLESYLSRRTKAEFSHSICPDCLKEHFPGMEDELLP